jgi:hypothetical protein
MEVSVVSDPELMKSSLRHRFIYSMAGLILGLLCIVGGMLLFLNGVAGSSSWTAKIMGGDSTLTDAAPGAILFIVGLFVVFITRYKMKLDRGRKKGSEWEKYEMSKKE